jgi:hypothetical protein
MTDATRTLARLRELCAWHEWSEPPNLAAADALQGAADALQAGALSIEAATLIATAWEPHVGAEANAGNVPPGYVIANADAELQRHIIADVRAMVARETTSAMRVYLTRLLQQQARRFAEVLRG